jgi:hypothetical protein
MAYIIQGRTRIERGKTRIFTDLTLINELACAPGYVLCFSLIKNFTTLRSQ